jgi:hypothetical protein
MSQELDIVDSMQCMKITSDTPTSDTPSNAFINIIKKQVIKEEKNNQWVDSLYKDLVSLQSNNVGICGEEMIDYICKKEKLYSTINGTNSKKKCIGDGYIEGKSVEIKTAMLGSDKKSFQHELGEYPWNSNLMLFLDISPNHLYITLFKNFTKEQYEEKGFKCKPYFPTKTITRRKGTGNFKLDTTIVINEANVLNRHTIKLSHSSQYGDVGKFIRRILNS